MKVHSNLTCMFHYMNHLQVLTYFMYYLVRIILKCNLFDFFFITGRTLKGEEAPLASQLNNWLDTHPGWEVLEESDDDEEEEEQDDEGSNQKLKKCSVEKELDEKEPIKKTKMEDDEYKNASEEHTYYRFEKILMKKKKLA